jgi:hypothetical protein
MRIAAGFFKVLIRNHRRDIEKRRRLEARGARLKGYKPLSS